MRGKTAVLILSVVLLFMGVLFVINGDGLGIQKEQSASLEESPQMLVESYSSLTSVMPEAGQPIARLQVPSNVNRMADVLTQRRNQSGFFCGMISMLCALLGVFFENVRSSLYSILLICLGFAGYHMSQIKIIHQMDGKKRIFTI